MTVTNQHQETYEVTQEEGGGFAACLAIDPSIYGVGATMKEAIDKAEAAFCQNVKQAERQNDYDNDPASFEGDLRFAAA